MDPDLILRRAADLQTMTDPDDALSRLVNRVLQETELSEDMLDTVAAARAQYAPGKPPAEKKRP